VGLGVTGKSFFVYAQKFSAGLCIFPLQSSALLFCHTQGFNNNEVEVLYKRDSSFITVDGWIEEDGKIIIVLEEYNE
jgi:hypothetical protein